jgi:hypothetical protein
MGQEYQKRRVLGYGERETGHAKQSQNLIDAVLQFDTISPQNRTEKTTRKMAWIGGMEDR